MWHSYRKDDYLRSPPVTSLWVVLFLLHLVTMQVSAQICNTPDWLDFGDNQYLIVNSPTRMYTDAMTYCQSLGGDLAIITSNEQNAFLNTFTRKDGGGDWNYWIGLNDMDGDWQYTWIDNSLPGYLNNDSTLSPGKCVRLRTAVQGQWQQADCNDRRVHICQRPKDPYCSWRKFGQSFYRIMGQGLNFDAAKMECINDGGRLAIIRYEQLNTFLTSIVSPALSSSHCYWIGLSRTENNDTFTFIDGGELSTTFWAPDEPNSNGQACACLWSDGIDDIHGKWDDRNCSNQQPYICERSAVLDERWRYIPNVKNVQYFMPNFSLNYFHASEYCEQIGGMLALLKTSAINFAVASLIGDGDGVPRYWFGLDDLGNEGDFRWVDGTLLNDTGFTNWIERNNNPDNQGGAEHCVEIFSAVWNDRSCSTVLRFICEKAEAPPLHVLAVTSTPYGSTGTPPRFSCLLSPPHNTRDILSYTKRAVVRSLTEEGYTLDVPGTRSDMSGFDGFAQDLPTGDMSVGVYKCSSTSTSTGISTSADVTILSNDRHFQPTDGRLTKTVYPEDDITLSVSTMDTYTAGNDQIRWSTFSNLAEGSLSPDGDGSLTYTIRSATKQDGGIYGTYQHGTIENLMYSLIRVIVSDCPPGRWNLPACDRLCDNCYNGGICHPQSGTCICPPGFMGENCLTACGENRFGWGCELECGPGKILETCSGSHICLPDPYGCNCLAGYTGIYCDERCSPGKFGVDCLQDCHCAGGIQCDIFTGRCKGACENGWSGEGCQVPRVCPDGYSGIDCTDFCNCPGNAACEKDSGFCISSGGQCAIDYKADSAEMPDRCDTFSGCFDSCSKTCHCAGGAGECNQETGECSSGSCHPRWMGDDCQTDRFDVVQEKANPGVAKFSCTFATESAGSLDSSYIKVAVGDFSLENLKTAQENDTMTSQSSVQSNFTFLVNVNENKPIYCFVGTPGEDSKFAYVRLPPAETFALPLFRNAPTRGELGHDYVIITWDSWQAGVDVGEGPIIGYKVYVSTSGGNGTHTSPLLTASSSSQDAGSSRKKRQGGEGSLMYNVSGLTEGTTYEIQIAVVREGLNGEGDKGPALSVTTREIIITPPSASGTHIGAITGGVLGGLVLLLLILVVIIVLLKRKRKQGDAGSPQEADVHEYESVIDKQTGVKDLGKAPKSSTDVTNEHHYQELLKSQSTYANTDPSYLTIGEQVSSAQGIELLPITQNDTQEEQLAYQNIGYKS